MAVRPIDGNELYRIEKLLDTDIVRQDKVALNLLEQVLYDIQHVPTLTTPNEPLTIEQLREMDGELVYLKVFDPLLESGWHVVKAVTEDKIVFRDLQPVYVPIKGMGTNYNLYRRPPEGEA